MSIFGLFAWGAFGALSIKDVIDNDSRKSRSRQRAIENGDVCYFDNKGHRYYLPTGERVIFTSEEYIPNPEYPWKKDFRSVLYNVKTKQVVYRYPYGVEKINIYNRRRKEENRQAAIVNRNRWYEYFVHGVSGKMMEDLLTGKVVNIDYPTRERGIIMIHESETGEKTREIIPLAQYEAMVNEKIDKGGCYESERISSNS